MGNGEREDENRKLAEWLGIDWAPCPDGGVRGCESYICRKHPSGVFMHRGKISDFRTDETANAMLLEKMAEETHDWRLLPDRDHTGHDGWSLVCNDEYFFDYDRKTAIVLAALALLNERGHG